MYSCMDLGLFGLQRKACHKILENPLYNNQLTHCCCQSHIFRMKSAQCCFGLQLAFPQEQTTTEEHDVTGAGAGTGGHFLGVTSMQSSEVSIHVAIHLVCACGFEDGSLGSGALQVSHNHLHRSSMGLLWCRVEASYLAYCKSYVWLGIGCQVEQHTHDR